MHRPQEDKACDTVVASGDGGDRLLRCRKRSVLGPDRPHVLRARGAQADGLGWKAGNGIAGADGVSPKAAARCLRPPIDLFLALRIRCQLINSRRARTVRPTRFESHDKNNRVGCCSHVCSSFRPSPSAVERNERWHDGMTSSDDVGTTLRALSTCIWKNVL